MAHPFVSVLIDTYNHERFIEQAITSVLEQDFPPSDREIIVIDDGSTDRTAEIVAKFAPQVRLLRKQNGGQASAFNAGIPECKGEIIAFLDGDDWWARKKLTVVTATLDRESEVSAVGHGIYETDEVEATRTTVQPNRLYRTRIRTVDDVREFLPLRAFLGSSRFIIRRVLLDRILPIPEAITIEADEFLFTLAAVLSDIIVQPEPLTHYRIHAGNLYQFERLDAARLKRKEDALTSLTRELHARLAQTNLGKDVQDLLVRPVWIDAERFRLYRGRAWPWESFRVERAAYQIAYRQMSLRYRIFQTITLGASLLLPPRTFYALRRWYGRTGLSRLRAQIAEATPTDNVTVRGTIGRASQ